MRFSSVADDFFILCSFDGELLDNTNRRPYILVLRLTYKKNNYDFAIPFRSNIPNYIDKALFFSLPPRPSTQTNHIHGLHYVKMFPIKREYLRKFYTDKDPYYQMLEAHIDKNVKTIISEAQAYLDEYEKGNKPDFCTDIDGIIKALFT